MINTIAITPSRELATTQPESESLMERAMARAARDIKTRWSSYDLPTVTPLSSFADFSAAAAKRREVAIERSACEKELSKAVTAIARGMAAMANRTFCSHSRLLCRARLYRCYNRHNERNAHY